MEDILFEKIETALSEMLGKTIKVYIDLYWGANLLLRNNLNKGMFVKDKYIGDRVIALQDIGSKFKDYVMCVEYSNIISIHKTSEKTESENEHTKLTIELKNGTKYIITIF